jgi:(+)-trans-carveol dehydrogenase
MTQNDELFGLFRPDLEAPTAADVDPTAARLNALPEPWAEPSDISDAVVWLASDATRFITGVILPVDLGQLLP